MIKVNIKVKENTIQEVGLHNTKTNTIFQNVLLNIFIYIERIQSMINVISKSTNTQKGRGNFHQKGKSGLLAWEEEDYSLANKKLINYGIKYKVNYYRNKNVRHYHNTII